jgi:hypothetical protein
MHIMSIFREPIGSSRWRDQSLFLRDLLITHIYILSAGAKKTSAALDKDQRQQADRVGGVA